MFEMRIYPPEYSWKKLVEQCRISSADANPFADSTKGSDIDIHKLNSLLRDLPVDEIQQRRRTLEVFYQEILLSAKRTDRGIGFTDLLMTLAHYKIIDNNKSLRLEEFLRRRARLGIVDDEVRRKIVKDFISTIYHRTRFLRKQDSQRASRILTVPQLQVPEIFVEDEDDSDRASTAGSARARPALTLTIPPNDEAAWRASGTDARDTPTSAGLRNRTESFSPRESPTRPSISPTRPSFQSQRSFQISPQLSPWRPSSSLPPSPLDFPSEFPAHDGILGGGDGGASPGAAGDGGGVRRSLSPVAPRGSGADAANRLSVGARRSTSTRDVLEVLEDSAWGESMRRSMTGARRGTRASSGAVSANSAGSRGSGGSGGAGASGTAGGGVEGRGEGGG